MKKVLFTLLLLLSGLCSAQAQTVYNISAGASASTITSTASTAAAGSGNTVQFAAGSYTVSSSLSLPCTNGVIYSGPQVGHMSIAYTGTASLSPNGGFHSTIVYGNLATATVTNSANGYAISVPSNGTSYSTPGAGCTFQNFNFSGIQGGIYVNYPASGLLIQNNTFQNNNPTPNDAGGYVGNAAIYLGGSTLSANGVAANGVSNTSILWNTALNNCYLISQAMYSGAPSNGGDNGGVCNFVHIQGYNSNVTVKDNSITGIEEGVKLFQQTARYTSSFNFDMEDNQCSANERICLEDQQSSNGNTIVSHNAFYEPWYPWALTFEISIPLYQCSTGTCGAPNTPSATANDNAIIDNETITETGSGAHLGIGIEAWGLGFISQYNLFQGGNGTGGTCGGASNGPCLGFDYSIGEAFTNINAQYNYFSGTDNWNGTVNGTSRVFTYEDGASSGNAGMNLSNNTVVQTSTTIQVATPTITAGTSNVSITPPDANHHYTIFYTTDGSTPAIFGPGGSSGTTQVYTAPFTPANGTVVKAIAHWGAGANQGIVFPYFGYVPSSVVSATYVGTSGSVTLSSIAITGTSSLIVGQAAVQLTATGTYSNSTTANISAQSAWVSSNTAVCTVGAATGLVTAVSAGTCSITATDSSVASSGYSATVAAATETSAWLSTTPVNGVNTMTVGGSTVQFQTIGGFNNGNSANVTASSWASSATGVCTVSSSGVVTAVAAGTCNITSVSGSSITSSYWTITVSSATLSSMSVAGNSSNLAIGQSEGLTATGIYSAGPTQPVTPASWTSSVPSVCSVSPTGQVTALSAGSCNITASLASITSSVYTITVAGSSASLLSVLVQPSFSIASGPFTLTAIGNFSDGSVNVVTPVWSSSNSNVATVNSSTGAFVPVGVGLTYITATVSGVPVSVAAVEVPPSVLFTNSVFPNAGSFCSTFPFQNLATGTYTLTVAPTGITIH